MKRFLLYFALSLALLPSLQDSSFAQRAKDSKIKTNKIYLRIKSNADINAIKIQNSLSSANPVLLKENAENNSRKYIGAKLKQIQKAESPLLRTYIVNFTDSTISAEDYCKRLMQNNPNIELAEPYYPNKILKSVPNDTFVSSQTMLETIKAFDAWDIWKGNPNCVVGISDNGVDQAHEDISPNLYSYNGHTGFNVAWQDELTNKDSNYTMNTSEAHGLEVAGIAGAATNNSKGVAGVGYNCKIFPIKATPDQSGETIDYGYESIIKAADMGFIKVLNCSWGGSQVYSQIEQDIIDYAIAKDVAIVAAAGNEFNSDYPIYPAAYKGVLAVGETFSGDLLSSSSSIGDFLDLMAPGANNYSTTGYTHNGYRILSGGGTSYSAPVVSGALALTRSKYTTLSPVEAMEFLRQCGDDIRSAQTNEVGFILPKRLNLLKAMQTEPMSMPSIRPLEYFYTYNNGDITYRLNVGDTVTLNIKATNYLASANNLAIKMSISNYDKSYFQIIDSVVNIAAFNRNDTNIIGAYKFIIKGTYGSRIYLRFDISGENSYTDFFTKAIIPDQTVNTLKNGKIAFSVADNGKLGYNGVENNSYTDLEGVGISAFDYGSLISTASGFVAATDETILSSIYGDGDNYSDFYSVKSYTNPNPNVGIFADSGDFVAPHTRLGIEVQSKFTFPVYNQAMVRADLKVTNNSNAAINNFAFGYYFDWDLGSGGANNNIKNIDSVLPDDYQMDNYGAELISRSGDYPYVATAVAITQKGGLAQCAGFSRDKYAGSNHYTYQISTLNNGKDFQTTTTGDIANMMGARFPGTFKQGEVKYCAVCFGADTNLSRLYANLKLCLDSNKVGVEETSDNSELMIYPNPAKDFVIIKNIESSEPSRVEMYNTLGELVQANSDIENNMAINVNSLPSGFYVMKIQTAAKNVIRYFSVTR